MAEKDDDFQKKWLYYFLVVLALGVVFFGPVMVVRYAVWAGGQVARFVLGLPGRPFGKTWFVPTRHVIWQTNFIGMPPNDAELARWLATQPTVAASEVRREPYWVVFDCVLRGYFLDPVEIKMASVRKAQTLGYDTGGRVAIIDIKE